ncbi:MAG: hypothetical protein HOD17_03060 [Desulfobacteraceae bacterium]|nr:hypothetical protein [Desulfobacteraceae bacterium]
MKQKAILSIIGVIAAIFLFISAEIKVPIIDENADEYFKTAVSEAALAYTTCRVINASVSIIKESKLQLEPAGIGLSLAIGQALDPIDDMTERLSDVIVTAIVSLGVQKIFYEISVFIAPLILSVAILLLSILIWSGDKRLKAIHQALLRVTLLVIIFRFFLPLSAVTNNFINKHFFQKKISIARSELALSSSNFNELKDFNLPEIDGIMGTIKGSASILKQKTIELKKVLKSVKNQTSGIIVNLLELTWLYAGVFFIQVIFLPLLAFWILTKMTNILFDTNFKSIVNSSDI